ncbi:FAD-binding oxidoreductase [Arthrobacter sp. Helios]|uniref:FAD-binding oxidoreductase n=1 Tax=Arthrobacter sp. Helios TaxID=2828862 RepID=UPI00204FC545|nr:FAD-binding oxidoreductase [Arthrobacter sp. Helios]UPO76303.1 FAD-binding oxidoreductase [Arthrobacter sp. Helios]
MSENPTLSDSASSAVPWPQPEASLYPALVAAVSGTVTLPGDEAYEASRRVWNGMIDVLPAAVVRAASPDDVAPVLAFAQATGLPLAVRGGGHNVAGNGTVDGGIVLDVGGLRTVEVDPIARTVTVGGGATLADVDTATVPFGMAVPLGVVSKTGVAGLTLGGGVGWMTRSHGLSVDNLLGADVVLADGTMVHASAEEEPELFWGLRGGGGNFGVVTSFTFQAWPVPDTVYSGNLVYHADRFPDALRAFDAWTGDLPDELTSIASFLVPPPDWDMGDDPILAVGFAWAGEDHQAADDAVRRLRKLAPPDAEMVDPVLWTDWQSSVDPLFPDGSRAYWKNTSFDALDADVIEVLTRRGREQAWRGTGFDIHHMGGAFARVPEDATSFPVRGAGYWLNVYGFWNDQADDEHHTAFVRGLAADMEPHASGGQYVNFMGAEDPVQAAPSVYSGEKLARLAALKQAVDPGNLFRRNHNIAPAGTSGPAQRQ